MNEKSERKTRKKNGAHTHVRTTVQFDEHNIHVGCCLFSHNRAHKNNNDPKSYECSSRYC